MSKEENCVTAGFDKPQWPNNNNYAELNVHTSSKLLFDKQNDRAYRCRQAARPPNFPRYEKNPGNKKLIG